MIMINFTNCPVNKFRAYDGNGRKFAVIYNNETYMLKFSHRSQKKTPNSDVINYDNSSISEYLGCHIYESMGFETQQTLYGTYSNVTETKEVVACKDFAVDGFILLDFAKIKNSCIGNQSNGYETELSTVLDAIESQQLISPEELKKHFWDMFIADALLGNSDRRNDDWGLLYNEKSEVVKIAPIYDCNSCLYPHLSEEEMKRVLSSSEELKNHIIVLPNSALKINGKKINYLDFISRNVNQDCTDALARTIDKIDLNKINKIIGDTSFLSDIQKEFYFTVLVERKNQILNVNS